MSIFGDVYMEIYLPAQDAVKVKIGADARIVFDVAPELAARAKVSFVAPEAQFTPKQVETRAERDKLMFRVKLTVPPERVLQYIERVKTGIRGIGYVRLDDSAEWPERLNRHLPEPSCIFGGNDIIRAGGLGIFGRFGSAGFWSPADPEQGGYSVGCRWITPGSQIEYVMTTLWRHCRPCPC